MRRIAFMVFRCLLKAPWWWFRVWLFGRKGDTHTEQERYEYLRYVVKKANRAGRVDVVCSGIENLPDKNGFILFPNHQGMFDMLAIIETCPNPVSVVVKKEASEIFLVKQVIELLHGISIDRKDIRGAKKVIDQMSEEVGNGRNYVIFAEGTRSRDGNNILEFKAGTFKSAVNAGCPIIPVALINSFCPFDIPSIKREKVQVHYMEPINPDQYVGIKTREIAHLVHDRIQKKIDENMG